MNAQAPRGKGTKAERQRGGAATDENGGWRMEDRRWETARANWELVIGDRRGEGHGLGGDPGAAVLGSAFPAVPVLAGADEDLLVGPRRPKAGQIERGDVVDPRVGRRQQTQINRPPHIGPPRTTGRGGEEPEVTLDTVMED